MKEIEMSTRCSILIEIPDDLIGQTLKYQRQDNEFNWNKNIDKTEPVKITKKYLGIYCHHDGYPNGVGSELVNRYDNFNSALNLILGGDCSSIFQSYVRYATRETEDWKWIQPKQSDTIKIVSGDSEYLYLYKPQYNQWYLIMSDIFIPLDKDMESLEDYVRGYLNGFHDGESFNQTLRNLDLEKINNNEY